jgi:hypothetical protein
MNNKNGWGGTESALIADIAAASPGFREHLLIVLSVGAPYARGCQNKTFAIRSEGGAKTTRHST